METTHLNARQMTVLKLISKGKSNQAIADDLRTSKHAIENVLVDIYCKLGVEVGNPAFNSRSRAVALALAGGVIAVPDVGIRS